MNLHDLLLLSYILGVDHSIRVPWSGLKVGYFLIGIAHIIFFVYWFYCKRKDFLHIVYYASLLLLDLLQLTFGESIGMLIFIAFYVMLYQVKVFVFIAVFLYPFYHTLDFKGAIVDVYHLRFDGFYGKHKAVCNYVLILLLFPVYLQYLFTLYELRDCLGFFLDFVFYGYSNRKGNL